SIPDRSVCQPRMYRGPAAGVVALQSRAHRTGRRLRGRPGGNGRGEAWATCRTAPGTPAGREVLVRGVDDRPDVLPAARPRRRGRRVRRADGPREHLLPTRGRLLLSVYARRHAPLP